MCISFQNGCKNRSTRNRWIIKQSKGSGTEQNKQNSLNMSPYSSPQTQREFIKSLPWTGFTYMHTHPEMPLAKQSLSYSSWQKSKNWTEKNLTVAASPSLSPKVGSTVPLTFCNKIRVVLEEQNTWSISTLLYLFC